MNQKDINRLRFLASQIRDIAELDIQSNNKELWRAVNDQQMIRPTVLVRDCPVCLLQDGTDELTPIIEDPIWRRVEHEMLLTIYEWNHLRGDTVVEPWINCPIVVKDEGIGYPSVANPMKWMSDKNQLSNARHFDRVLFNEEDLLKIKASRIEYDEARTMDNFSKMKEMFAGILDVKLMGKQDFKFWMWDDLMSWLSIEEGMLQLVSNPEFLHKAAKCYVEAAIDRAKQYEQLGLVSSNNSNVLVGMGGYGYCSNLPKPTDSGIGSRLQDIWGTCTDQLFTSVSPAMTEEFAFSYESQWSALYPQIYYGCCERLDNKSAELKSLKGLKKVSVSPFSKLDAAMEKFGPDYIISFKADSIFLTETPWNKEALKKELKDVCALAKKYHCHVEIIMKTILTLGGDPQRLWEWCDMAKEIVENY